jgi:COP9 signalosome complex subunit 2
MSDDDDDGFMMEEDEEFDFEFESGDDEAADGDDTDVDLENKYYAAKGLKDEDPDEALREFQGVLKAQEGTLGDWGFKALKQSLKLSFALGRLTNVFTVCFLLHSLTLLCHSHNRLEN